MSGAARRWLWALALISPVILLYICQYLSHRDGGSFSGFLVYDMGLYMADARSSFTDGFHLFYGNPFSPDPNTPRIFFQPQFLILGAMQALTGGDPGTVLVVFGFLSALVCARVAIALYEEMAGVDRPGAGPGLILFFWGGGVLVFTGLIYHALSGRPPSDFMTDALGFDPFYGWWFLNLGQNLVLPTEAYYHAVAFGAVLMAIRERYKVAIALAFLLSISHPFTGIQFLCILLAWCGLERVFIRSKTPPWWFAGALLGILIFHLGYYLVFLNQFPEQRSVFEHYSKSWFVHASSFVPADALVGLLAYYAMRNLTAAGELFSRPANRLLLAWFVVSFLLVHHEFAVEARQPIHFSRGYTWIPLFLLGVQPLLQVLGWCRHLSQPLSRAFAITVLMTLGLFDNLFWFAHQSHLALATRYGKDTYPEGLYLRDSDRQLHVWLKARPLPHRNLLITPDYEPIQDPHPIMYLSVVYTGYRAAISHCENTPFYLRRGEEQFEYFRTGKVPEEWRGRPVLIIRKLENPLPLYMPDAPVVYENKDYRVQAMTMP